MTEPSAMSMNETTTRELHDSVDNLVYGELNFNTTDDVDSMANVLLKMQNNSQKNVFELTVELLNLYLIPVIIAVGLVGNVVSALVFSCTHLRCLSSSLYLTWLSLADIGFLLALTVAWLDRIGVHWMTSDGWCQVMVYLSRVCACLSVWFVLSFTAERYVLVYHALRRDQLCTVRRAKVAVAATCGVTSALYLYVFPTYQVLVVGRLRLCAPAPAYSAVMTAMTSVDTLLACVLPSLAILGLNARIIHRLHRFQATRLRKDQDLVRSLHHQNNNNTLRKHMIHTVSMSTAGSMRIKFSNHDMIQLDPESPQSHMLSPDKCQRLVRSRGQLRTARMLLVVSSMFVLLSLPSHVLRVHAFLRHMVWDNIKTPRAQYKVHEFFSLFFFLNFAINFFVYSLCGKQFRVGLMRLCGRLRYKLHKRLITAGRRHADV